MRSAVFAAACVLAVVTGACKSTKSDPTSTVQGQLSVASFGFAPTGVDAIDERGARTHVDVAADGTFRLDLLKGHLYKVVVVGAGREEPMVFPRKTGRLDLTFRVSSGAGVVTLGLVRHLDSAPTGGFVTQPAATTIKPATEGAEGEVGECVNGQIQGTGAACVDDDAKVTCEDGSAASDGDGECENGKDTTTGQACTDTDQVGEADADAARPMAIPEKNPPDDIDGCKDETDDDDEEDEDGEEDDD